MAFTITRFCLCLASLLVFTTHGSWAQTASISGTVVSDKDETLVGAVVTAVHLPTGIRRSATTSATGSFSIPEMLHGGPYTLQVTQLSYRPQLLTNVFLVPNKVMQLNLQLVTEVVAVGTRRVDRTALESAVPIDVVNMRELVTITPQTDVTQILTYVVPSFNSNRQTSAGGSDHIDPSSLRGLGTDQMLVLVNGKRRHTTALINLLGNRGVGNVGYDLNTLPGNGIDRVEILRDGAAAQYGSDAIAGVMNIGLKTDSKGGNVLVSSGIHTAGDGLSTLLSVNKGLKLGTKGFLNLTGDVDHRGSTTRDYSRDLSSRPVFSFDAAEEAAFLKANGKTYADFEQQNGDAQIRNVRGLFNASLPVSDQMRFYSFGGYNFRRGKAVAPWVLPATQPADIVPSIFPLGYQPNINTRVHDASGAVGAVLDLKGWSLDLSHVVGYNQMRYDLNNTLNTSMGESSPTEFEAGGYQFRQNVTNATANRLFPTVLAGTSVAFGAEYRTEKYEIVAGDEASSRLFDSGSSAIGSQGFVGFSRESAESSLGTRNNVGGFLDVEVDITKKWSVNTALRYENYSDFGSAFIYKVTSRLQLLKPLAVRAAYNTGFRAPSLQQEFFSQLTSTPTPEGVFFSGLFNNSSPVAVAAGIPKLKEENSRNISAGLVLTPSPIFSVAVDAYQINIDDRIVLSGIFRAGSTPELDGALRVAQVSQAQFFTNAVDTRTQGVDVVTSFRKGVSRGTLSLSAAVNLNRTTIQKIQVPPLFQGLATDRTPQPENALNLSTSYVDQRQLSLLRTGNPRGKAFLTAGYELGKASLLARGTYFGAVSYYDSNPEGNDFGSYFLQYDPRFVTDLILTYRPIKELSLTGGVQNLFDVYPNTRLEAARNGRPPGEGRFATVESFNNYYQTRFGRPSNLPGNRDIFPYDPVQMGFNGRFVYLKAAYNIGL
jgi:iron complex outermembrane receptor protein